jgi:hypothetical protein
MDALSQSFPGDADALQQALGYLLFVGAEPFAFYLMLWELLFTADADLLGDEAHG